jgi:NAD(P)-dependent dehydrogenase (short-subunit alcohol dehydrogenase family)
MKTILITGASRGIGAAAARINYRKNAPAADLLVREIEGKGGKAIAIQADVAVEPEVVRLFEKVDTSLGPLSALVNNAGIVEQQMRLDQMTADRLQRIFNTNVTASFLCSREAVRRMSTRYGGKGGVIVNVSSMAAQLGAPGEYIDYAATKAAVDALTVGLAKEVAAEGIRVNAVRPGIIHTEIHASGGEPNRVERVKDSIPMKRGGLPQEVANAILWLVSDEASYCAGAFINVSGGR